MTVGEFLAKTYKKALRQNDPNCPMNKIPEIGSKMTKCKFMKSIEFSQKYSNNLSQISNFSLELTLCNIGDIAFTEICFLAHWCKYSILFKQSNRWIEFDYFTLV